MKLLEVDTREGASLKERLQEMTLFKRYVAQGNDRADGLAKDGALLDGGEMAQIRDNTVQRRRERCPWLLQDTASFHC